MALVYILYIAIIFYWQIKTIKAGKSTKRKAIGLYAVYTSAPILLYGIVFIAFVGVEELANTALIGEEYARSLLFVVVGGLVLVIVTTLLFSAIALTMKVNNINST